MEKIASNVIFDEAHYSTGSVTPGSKTLKLAGSNRENETTEKINENTNVRMKRIHPKANSHTDCTKAPQERTYLL